MPSLSKPRKEAEALGLRAWESKIRAREEETGAKEQEQALKLSVVLLSHYYLVSQFCDQVKNPATTS